MKSIRTTLLAAAGLAAASCVLLAAPAAKSSGPQVKPQWWGPPPGPRPQVVGTVANVSAENIAVQTRQGVRAFVVNAQTRVIVRGQAADISAVKAGDPVHVKFVLQQDNVPLAVRVNVYLPAVKGKVTGMDGGVLVVQTDKGQFRAVLTAQTAIRSRGYRGSAADLKPGYTVRVAMQGDAAKSVDFAPTMARGTVTAVNGDIITVKTVRQMVLELAPSQGTAVLVRPRVGPNKKGTLADVKVGLPVNIGFHANPNGASPLLWVDVLTGM